MAPNERAVKNHEELFPNHVSTLAVTDPELIDTFDDFAFDEVLSHSSLDVRTRLMVQLAAIVACQALTEYRVMAGAALNVGVTSIEIKEIAYQAVPYLGIAKVLDFIHATNDVLNRIARARIASQHYAQHGAFRSRGIVARVAFRCC
jgi:4-carboxymuconolactone decarboxylase